MTTQRDIENWFTFHPVADDRQRHGYELMRVQARSFASQIVEFVPVGVEQKKAIEALREAVMWANAGIACNPKPTPPDAPYATERHDWRCP